MANETATPADGGVSGCVVNKAGLRCVAWNLWYTMLQGYDHGEMGHHTGWHSNEAGSGAEGTTG